MPQGSDKKRNPKTSQIVVGKEFGNGGSKLESNLTQASKEKRNPKTSQVIAGKEFGKGGSKVSSNLNEAIEKRAKTLGKILHRFLSRQNRLVKILTNR